ncbi:MAG: serine/threonine-protein kinase [Solirubrobacterales bacterium]
MSLPVLEPGTTIAPGYELITHLSRGRRLDVYDAWDRRRGCRCVVKALRPERLDEMRARESLLEEGRLLCRLSHPHLVRGYETLAVPEPLVIMETLGGRTLAHMIETDGSLSAPDAAQLGLQLGSVVRYLHANGVLHLDLKPSNVVAEARRAKVIDLSVARAPGPAPAEIGTWWYMAPEQVRGGVLGAAADVWGIGAVLFEAMVGEAPFEDLTEDDTSEDSREFESTGTGAEGESPTGSSLEAHAGPWLQLERPAARIDELVGAEPALADVVAACLEPAPERRPTVVELMAGLEPLTGLPRSEWRWQSDALRPAHAEGWPDARQLQDRGRGAAQHPLRRG